MNCTYILLADRYIVLWPFVVAFSPFTSKVYIGTIYIYILYVFTYQPFSMTISTSICLFIYYIKYIDVHFDVFSLQNVKELCESFQHGIIIYQMIVSTLVGDIHFNYNDLWRWRGDEQWLNDLCRRCVCTCACIGTYNILCQRVCMHIIMIACESAL